MIEKSEAHKLESLEEQLIDFRLQIKEIQKECLDKYLREQKGQKCDSGDLEFLGAEILEVNPEELNYAEMGIYNKLGAYEDKEIDKDQCFREVEKYRRAILLRHVEIMAERPNYNFKKDSLENFSAWTEAKWIALRVEEYKKEKEQQGGVA